MKVIVINDSDGHTSALTYSAANLRAVLQFAVDGAVLDHRLESEAAVLLDEESEDTARLEQCLCRGVLNCNGRGGQLCILEIADNPDDCNPFC